jgi:probable rRNA maturation factor
MAMLNRQFRNRRGVTDVLSFPALCFRSGKPVFSAGDRDPETGEAFLGDIVICLPRMRRQADAFGHGMDRELGFLAVHGILHLLGQDHETTEEEHLMFRMQETALTAMGLSRPGGGR